MKRRPSPRKEPLPLATAAFAATIVAVFALELAGDGATFCARFGLVPARPNFGSALTSLFVHDPSSLLHVGGNLIFLVVFGVIVERKIGSFRFLVLYFAGGLAGAALHIIADPTSTVPLVGASSSLFALLAVGGAYFGPPMLGFVAVLVGSNVLHAFGVSGDATVSFASHIGGFLAGTAAVALARVRGVDLRRTVAA